MTKASDKAKQAPSVVVTGVRPAMWDKAALAAGVTKCHAAMNDVQKMVTETAVQALMHLEAHQDTDTLNKFLVGFPKGFKRQAMADWLFAYGCVKLNPNKDVQKTHPLVYAKDKVCKIDEAIADPWFNFQPEPEVITEFDFQKALASVIAKAQGKTLKLGDKVLTPEAAADMLKAAQALVGSSVKVA